MTKQESYFTKDKIGGIISYEYHLKQAGETKICDLIKGYSGKWEAWFGLNQSGIHAWMLVEIANKLNSLNLQGSDKSKIKEKKIARRKEKERLSREQEKRNKQ